MGITVIPTRHAQKPEAGVILVHNRILSAQLYGPHPKSRFVICQDWEGSGDSLKGQGPVWLQCHHKALLATFCGLSPLHNSTSIPESSLSLSIPLFLVAVGKGEGNPVPVNCRFCRSRVRGITTETSLLSISDDRPSHGQPLLCDG